MLIATHVTGQIPYYSKRPVLDLLGLSDRVVANSPPKAKFRPGHNKWNYEYSIAERKPDIIADSWGNVGAFIDQLGTYVRLQNGLYVKHDLEPSVLEKLKQPIIKW